jgi:hypothetical protein
MFRKSVTYQVRSMNLQKLLQYTHNKYADLAI